MSKRLLTLFLCLLLPLSLTGCGKETAEEGYLLYFQERDLLEAAGGGALGTESLPLAEGLDTQAQAETLLNALLAGPASETLRSPFPSGTSLVDLTIEGSQAHVDLSAAYGTLSGVALTLADQAICLTLTQLPEIFSVRITVLGRELAYRDRQLLTARDVLLAPEGDVVSTMEATLFFPDESGILLREVRTLTLYEGDTQAQAVAQALEDGPTADGLFPAFPEGFRPRTVWMEGENCYVNLSSATLALLPEDTDLTCALDALRWSLKDLETVEAVWFLVDGELAQSYGNVPLPVMERQLS